MIVADGTDEAYEAFVGLFAQPPFGPQAVNGSIVTAGWWRGTMR